jgi:hypothetical protein
MLEDNLKWFESPSGVIYQNISTATQPRGPIYYTGTLSCTNKSTRSSETYIIAISEEPIEFIARCHDKLVGTKLKLRSLREITPQQYQECLNQAQAYAKQRRKVSSRSKTTKRKLFDLIKKTGCVIQN